MDLRIIFFATYETVLSVTFGLLTIFTVYKALNKAFLSSNLDSDLKKGNIAVSIFAGAITICVLILVQSSILPSVNALRAMVLSSAKIHITMVLLSLGYFLVFYLISVVISVVVILLSIGIYMRATKKIDEIEEIKKNNIAVAVILSLVILGVMLFIKPSVSRLISSFVNYEMVDKKIVKTIRNSVKEKTVPPPKVVIPDNSK